MTRAGAGTRATAGTGRSGRRSANLLLQTTWRNLWRNRRRTFFTAGGIAFAVLLVVFAMGLQLGSYDSMIENATGLLPGEIQVQSEVYIDNPRIDYLMDNASALLSRIQTIAGVAEVAPRVESYALVSVGERSYGARILGVDVARERTTVDFFDRLVAGTPPSAPGQGLIGARMAKNLDAELGSELVVLGTARKGGVAALVLEVAGVFETGIAELDRALVMAPLTDVQLAFETGDSVHTFVIDASSKASNEVVVAALNADLPPGVRARGWQELMPDVAQSIEVDRLSARLFYWLIIALVVFSVANTFVMTIFDRTKEFGMLTAVGMPRYALVSLIQLEALFMWLVGALVGLALAGVVLTWLNRNGLYLGEAMEQMAEQYYMPARLYPAINADVLLTAPVLLLFGTQVAALIPGLRLLRMRPTEALRGG